MMQGRVKRRKKKGNCEHSLSCPADREKREFKKEKRRRESIKKRGHVNKKDSIRRKRGAVLTRWDISL